MKKLLVHTLSAAMLMSLLACAMPACAMSDEAATQVVSRHCGDAVTDVDTDNGGAVHAPTSAMLFADCIGLDLQASSLFIALDPASIPLESDTPLEYSVSFVQAMQYSFLTRARGSPESSQLSTQKIPVYFSTQRLRI